jgi:signal transduction histidine kinase
MATVRQNTLEAARIQAQVAFEKDVIYRRWNTGHGGVYVPVTKEVQPNLYLSDIPERDITTPSGRLLTLINPAYMTRQVHELAAADNDIRGHITSLKPIRPENTPDAWETEALRTFERGEIEVSSVVAIDGREYMRLMRPLLTEQGCLLCHAAQEYQVGDIRGGISVSIPMEPLWAVSRSHMLNLTLSHGLLWLVGLGVIGVGSRRLARESKKRKMAERALRESTAQLEAANRELSDFAHSVSHDLKAPLRGISQLAGWIKEDYVKALDEGGQEKLGLLIDQTKHLHNLIDGILQYSRVGRVEAVERRVDLNQLVQETIELLAPPKNMRISVLNKLPTIVGVRTHFEQVFQNLLSNAMNFMDKAEGSVRIGCVEEEDEWQFSVADNGPGIEEKYYDKIFQIFQTLAPRDEVESTGIGLTLVKKAVEAWGGRIWVESKVGEGSTFFFTLPKKGESDERA